MTDTEIIEYIVLYSAAVDMHRALGSVFLTLDSEILELDDKSVQSDSGGSSSKQDPSKLFVPIIRSTYQNILTNFSQIGYMEGSFVELFKYVQKETGMSLDEYLTKYNLVI